jgi:hypothetical protein
MEKLNILFMFICFYDFNVATLQDLSPSLPTDARPTLKTAK